MKIRARYGHFNWIAPIYDRIFGSLQHDGLLAHLQAESGQHILDVGGGTGRVARHLAVGQAHVIVVDPSPVMLAESRKKGLSAVRALAEALPFADNSVERMLIVDAFHHFADQHRAAHELMRILRPGGRLVIEEPDLRRFPVKLIALAEKLALMQSHFYAPDDLAELFRGAGGRLLAIVPDGISVHVVLSK